MKIINISWNLFMRLNKTDIIYFYRRLSTSDRKWERKVLVWWMCKLGMVVNEKELGTNIENTLLKGVNNLSWLGSNKVIQI